jgi:putative SOS response-associated peptidase YedK
MLTINADGHPLMQRFHEPDDEKRMVVVLPEADHDRWLDAPAGRMREFLERWPAEDLEAEPPPRLPVKRRTPNTEA